MLEISCMEMKAMDAYTINEIGIPSIVLMENAALQVIETIDLDTLHSFTIVCAPGNNGGDGLAIARHLFVKDKKVDLFIVGDLHTATSDFLINLKILKNMKVEFTEITNSDGVDQLSTALRENDLAIDAIFGIGLDRPVAGLFYKVIEQINQLAKKIVAVDIPSGLNGDSGEVLGISIQAHQTICFHLLKKGLAHNKIYTGKITIAKIGIPKSVTQKIIAR